MKRFLFQIAGFFLAVTLGLAVAQQINRSVQISQDPTGPIGFDNFLGTYFPGKLYTTNNQTSPTIHSCGTSPTLNVGTDTAGRAQFGTATATCSIFIRNWPMPRMASPRIRRASSDPARRSISAIRPGALASLMAPT